MKFPYVLLLAFPLVLACSRPEYDISEGVNTEITLFENEISVPIGSAGPFSLGMVFDKLAEIEGVGEFFSEYLKVNPDGFIYTDDAGSIYEANVYELEKEMDDPGVSQTLDVGGDLCYLGGLMGVMSYLGLSSINQQAAITVDNPLNRPIPVTGRAYYVISGEEEDEVVPLEGLDSFTIPSRSYEKELATLDIPGDLYLPISAFGLDELQLTLPNNPTSRISRPEGNVCVAVNYQYKSQIRVTDAFALPLGVISVGPVDIPIGKFKLKKCELSLEIENTLPMRVEVKDFQLLLPPEKNEYGELDYDDASVDENVRIVADFTIPGGTLENPAVTPLTFSIEALEGTLPDISGLRLSVNLQGQPGQKPTPLSIRQGLFVKSSSARLTGGITIPQE